VRRRLFTSFAIAVMGAAIPIAQSSTQQQQSQDQQPPVFRTQANFVRVDAYPTRNGQPVLDLKEEDFEIF